MVNPLVPKIALLYYTADQLDSPAIDYWQIHHIFMDENGIPQLKAGEPVKRKTLEALCHTMLPVINRRLGWVDPRLLGYGWGIDGPLIFWCPPVRKPMYFGKSADLKSGVVEWPSLILVARPDSLQVFVSGGIGRPELKTPLLKSPFYNVNAQHGVCCGSSQIPDHCWPAAIPGWTAAFYRSAFTHTNAEDEAILKKGTMRKLWGDLISGRRKRFPYHLLKPAGFTVGGLLERIGLGESERQPSTTAITGDDGTDL